MRAAALVPGVTDAYADFDSHSYLDGNLYVDSDGDSHGHAHTYNYTDLYDHAHCYDLANANI